MRGSSQLSSVSSQLSSARALLYMSTLKTLVDKQTLTLKLQLLNQQLYHVCMVIIGKFPTSNVRCMVQLDAIKTVLNVLTSTDSVRERTD